MMNKSTNTFLKYITHNTSSRRHSSLSSDFATNSIPEPEKPKTPLNILKNKQDNNIIISMKVYDVMNRIEEKKYPITERRSSSSLHMSLRLDTSNIINNRKMSNRPRSMRFSDTLHFILEKEKTKKLTSTYCSNYIIFNNNNNSGSSNNKNRNRKRSIQLKNKGIFQKFQFPTSRNVVLVQSEKDHIYFLTDKGDIFSYSYHNTIEDINKDNNSGENSDTNSDNNEQQKRNNNNLLSEQDDQDRDEPVISSFFLLEHSLNNISICRLACGNNHSIVLTTTGEVYSWGCNQYGQLGLGDKLNYYNHTPQLITLLLNKQIISIKCGSDFNVVKSSDNTIYIWGRNNCGQLGLGDTLNRYEPMKLIIPEKFNNSSIYSFSCGNYFTMYFDTEGVVYSCGLNNEGQCGIKPDFKNNNLNYLLKLNRVYNIPGKVVQISCGENHTLVLTNDNKLFSWGSCEYGQLGIGRDKIYAYKPQEVLISLNNDNIINIECNRSNHCIVSTVKNNIYVWGCNSNNCLGMNNNNDIYTFPTLLDNWNSNEKVINIYTNNNYSIIVTINSDSTNLKEWEFNGLNNELKIYRKFLLQKTLKRNRNTRIWYNEISPKWLIQKKKSDVLLDWLNDGGVPEMIRRVLWPKSIGNNLKITPDTYALYLKLSERNFLLHTFEEEEKENDLLLNDDDNSSENNNNDSFDDDEESVSKFDKQDSIKLIISDLNRTFNSLELFHENEPLHERTKEVLEAYSCFRADIGYVQGMSYVAALLTLHIPSNYIVFQCLANIFASEHFHAFYSLKMELIAEYYEVFEKILANHLKNVSQYFEKLGLKCEVFLYNWLQSIFMQCLPVNICSRIMDNFLIFGFHYLIKVTLAIIKLLSSKLLTYDYDECVMLLTASKRMNSIWDELINENKLFSEIESIHLSNDETRQISKLVKEVFFYYNEKSTVVEKVNNEMTMAEVYEAIGSIC